MRPSPIWIAAATLVAAATAHAASIPARAIPGNTLHGFEDDGEFFDYYAKDGSATSLQVNSNDVAHGRWTIEGANLCITYPNDTPTCYSVAGSSPALILTDTSSGQAFPVQVLKGNPKNLK
jgi:hypothetical protein